MHCKPKATTKVTNSYSHLPTKEIQRNHFINPKESRKRGKMNKVPMGQVENKKQVIDEQQIKSITTVNVSGINIPVKRQ